MIKKNFKEYSLITIGVILVAIAMEYFFIPNEIAAGGVTGLAIIINNYFPFISAGPLVFIINIILFGVAFFVIGGNFGSKTIYASFGLSICMWIIEKFLVPHAITADLLVATLSGTFISAIGMAMVFSLNASTGGTDIVAKILNKFLHLDIGKSLVFVDLVIIALGIMAFGLDKGCYALLSVIITGIAIDNAIEGFNLCKKVTIISEKSEEISKYILQDLNRGCTFVKGIGGFTGKETTIIYAVLGRSEFIKLKRHIIEVDEKAFITVGEVHEVMGEGFKGIKED
ncbi:YitT family protein [Clostridium gasigenes]|uniref:YitT family protein n=1 Tax=Clostridium gasigenes TaxID=94869 RepID=UPI0016261712|nr:YitT family protein [Clostridium gasigenes]MBB6625136.1 YitT family protein [Clostridium gasigenes]